MDKIASALTLAGHGPLLADGKMIIGRVGADLDIEAGFNAARQTGLSILATLALVTALMCALITYETISYGEGRARVRHEDFAPEPPAS